jgi:hypothetical protein
MCDLAVYEYWERVGVMRRAICLPLLSRHTIAFCHNCDLVLYESMNIVAAT